MSFYDITNGVAYADYYVTKYSYRYALGILKCVVLSNFISYLNLLIECTSVEYVIFNCQF